MTNLKNEAPKVIGTKAGPFKSWTILLGVVLVAILAVAPTLLGLADAGGVKGHSFDITFTKWVTTPPNMVGVVGGDVGAGTFAGEIVSMTTEGNFTKVVARYHINGSEHSLSADIKATQDNVAGTGEITGTVTDGWLKDMSLTGEYTVEPTCPIDVGQGNYYGAMCFQGTLHVLSVP